MSTFFNRECSKVVKQYKQETKSLIEANNTGSAGRGLGYLIGRGLGTLYGLNKYKKQFNFFVQRATLQIYAISHEYRDLYTKYYRVNLLNTNASNKLRKITGRIPEDVALSLEERVSDVEAKIKKWQDWLNYLPQTAEITKSKSKLSLLGKYLQLAKQGEFEYNMPIHRIENNTPEKVLKRKRRPEQEWHGGESFTTYLQGK